MAHCGAPPGGPGYDLQRCNADSSYQAKISRDWLRTGRPGFGSHQTLSSFAAPLN
jgi:hypothetical protein